MHPRVAAMSIVAALAGCDRRAPVESCAESLHGVYVTPSGARWMLLDNGRTLELFPLFDDTVLDGAPRVIDLARGDSKLSGHVKRRFMQRAAVCEARAPVTVTACKANALQLVIGEVTSPVGYEPCSWGQQVPSRVEVWNRE